MTFTLQKQKHRHTLLELKHIYTIKLKSETKRTIIENYNTPDMKKIFVKFYTIKVQQQVYKDVEFES